MKILRMLAFAAVASLLLSTSPVTASERDPTRDFDFWQGNWKVTVQAALPDGTWRTAEGGSSTRKLAGDHAQMDTLDTGEYKSSGIRAFNVATGQWDYTMFDTLQMKGLQVWRGQFEQGVGTFEATFPLPNGAFADTRIIIDNIEKDHFQWRLEVRLPGKEQDWSTNFKMDFRRAP